MCQDDLLRPHALFEAIAASLRERIFRHQLAPGCALDESALATGYGVSRTPVREALKVLAHEGLVDLHPRRGSSVACLDADDVAALFGVLELLERHLLAQALSRKACPAAPADLGARAGDPHAAEAVARLRVKLRLALGPALQSTEETLYAECAAALQQAFHAGDGARASTLWQDFATQRRQRLGARERAIAR